MDHWRVPAPAKLNLFLHILGRRDDGYHDIQTAFQFIDWCDELQFTLRKDDAITLKTTLADLPVEENLVMKAADAFQRASGCRRGVDIYLKKNIPVGSGLGGGSSDAATTLLALNRLWEVGLSCDDVLHLGAELGADVPVFLHGHAAWAEGIGEQLTSMILPELWYVVMVPPVQINTQALYNHPQLSRNTAALLIGDYQAGEGHNDFEVPARRDYPEITQALEWLGRFGPARMTGSGSAVFSGFDSEEEAGTIAAQVPPPYKTMVVKGQNQSPLHKVLKRLE